MREHSRRSVTTSWMRGHPRMACWILLPRTFRPASLISELLNFLHQSQNFLPFLHRHSRCSSNPPSAHSKTSERRWLGGGQIRVSSLNVEGLSCSLTNKEDCHATGVITGFIRKHRSHGGAAERHKRSHRPGRR